jgi:hypothetical protein
MQDEIKADFLAPQHYRAMGISRISEGRREVDPPCITLTGMQLKEGDVKDHSAEVTE